MNFLQDHGYPVNQWLPILFHRNGHAANSDPSVWWITDEPDNGDAHIADYRATVCFDDALEAIADSYSWLKATEPI